jgi:hypothetical protein
MKNISAVCISFLLLFACENDSVKTESGAVKFSITTEAQLDSGGRTRENTIPAFVLVTIKDSKGNIVEENHKLPLIGFGAEYISESLTLRPGIYSLEVFAILDQNNQSIYATPTKGSPLAYLVSEPLPLKFEVSENESTMVVPEVLTIGLDDTPEMFGYVGFGFKVIPSRTKRLKEVTTSYGDFNTVYKTYYYYSGDALQKTETYYCYDGCNLTSFNQYHYENSPFVEIESHSTTSSVSPLTKLEFNSNGKLKRRWLLNDPSSNDFEFEYYYDANDRPTHAIQKYDGATIGSRLWEYSLDEDHNITSVAIYSLKESGEKHALLFKVDYTFGEGLNPHPFRLGEFVPYQNRTIASQRVIHYSNVNGTEIEQSNCTFTLAYSYNAQGLPVKETTHNSEGCISGESDGAVRTFVYF